MDITLPDWSSLGVTGGQSDGLLPHIDSIDIILFCMSLSRLGSVPARQMASWNKTIFYYGTEVHIKESDNRSEKNDLEI